MDKLKNFLHSHGLFSFQSKKGVHTSSLGKVGSSQQVKRNFSEDVFTMKNLLNKPSASNAKKFNAIANDAFYSSFADEASKRGLSSIAILREVLEIDSMSFNDLKQMTISFEKANQKGQLNDYDPVVISMFLEALKARLNEESRQNPTQGCDVLAIRIQKIITDITTPKQKDVHMEKLGSGVFNTVYKFETGQPPRTMVFKPENPNIRRQMTGEVVGGVRGEERNVVTSHLAHKLGFDSIVHTEFAHINGQNGIVMEKAQGDSQLRPYTYTFQPTSENQSIMINEILKNRKNYSYSKSSKRYELNQTMQKSLKQYLGVLNVQLQLPKNAPNNYKPWQDSNLQLVVTQDFRVRENPLEARYQRRSVELGLLDWIAGQTDRHVGNIMGGQGIDNDNGWTSLPLDLRNFKKEDITEKEYRNVRPPLVVDEKMKASIEELSEDDLRAMLVGYLTHAEIEAAVGRLDQVKEHLNGGKVKVIKPDKWGTKEVKDLLCTKEIDPGGYAIWTSYLGREEDMHNRRAQQKVKIMTPEQFEDFKNTHPLKK